MKNIKKWFSVAAFALLSQAGVWAQTDLEAGRTAFLAGDYTTAIPSLERALEREPNSLEAQAFLAYSHYVANAPMEAARPFWEALRNPDWSAKFPLMAFHYGETLKVLGKYEDAKQAYKMLEGSKFDALVESAVASCDFALRHESMKPVYLVRAEAAVNSPRADYAPTFYKNKLFFVSARETQLQGSVSDVNFRWVHSADRATGSGLLSNAKNLFSGDNDLIMNSGIVTASFSGDDKWVAFFENNALRSGLRHLMDFNIKPGIISVAKASTANKWDLDPAREFKPFGGLQDVIVAFPALSADGNTLYFSANSNKGYGGFDLFVCFYQNGKWSEPQNLGGNVNTPGDEISPFIADDGSTLYFASNYHAGFGGYDVFAANKEVSADGKAKIWRDVRNLGASINSSYDDMYFVYDEANRMGYFSSNREGGKGDYDIYSAQLIGKLKDCPYAMGKENPEVAVYYPEAKTPTPPAPNNGNSTAGGGGKTPNPKEPTPGGNKTPTPPAPNPNGERPATHDMDDVPQGLNFYVGAVVDGLNRQYLQGATVYLKNMGTQEKTKTETNKFGEYSVSLDPMTEYQIVVSKQGYEIDVFQVDTKSGGQRTLLGTRALQRAGTTSADVDIFGDPIYPQDPAPTPTPPSPAYESGTRKYAPATADKSLPDTGYLVQIGTFNKLNENKLKEVEAYGNILSEKTKSGAQTFRVGIFAEKTHADQAKKELQKMGFADAWVLKAPIDNKSMQGKIAASAQVIYPLDENAEPNYYPNNGGNLSTTSKVIIRETNHDTWADNNGDKVASRGMSTKTTTIHTPKANEGKTYPLPPAAVFVKGTEFRVQLGAFRQPQTINFDHLADLGFISTMQQPDGLTFFYLGSFTHIESAQNARNQAQTRGVQAPFVVAFKGGKRISVTEAQKK